MNVAVVQSRIHLWACACAIALLAIGSVATWLLYVRVEDRWVDAVLSESIPMKDMSLAWQRAALRKPDVLPLYGTSELQMPAPALASEYFASRPTGFAVEPLGHPGASCLLMAQRLAALGPAVRGRKVAVVISPSFFCLPWSRPRAYASNFSPLIAGECLFSTALSRPLRQRFAECLSIYPETLRKRPMLVDAAALLRRDSALAKFSTALLAPLGRAENLLYEFQDHAAAVSFLREHDGEVAAPARAARKIDWPAEQQHYTALAEPFPAPHPSEAQKRVFEGADGAGAYRHAMLSSPEWQNFTLLLDTAHALHVRLLVLAIPLNGVFFGKAGLPREGRAFFYDHLERVCASHRAALRDFREWDEDAKFFRDMSDHITCEAWILIDQTLDDFYHDRPINPLPGPAPQERPPAEEKSREVRAKLS